MKKLLIFFLLLLNGNLNAENITLDIAQISSFFDSHSNGKVNPVPFNLRQLESFHKQLGVKGKEAKNLTRKYLKFTYPKGSIAIGKINSSSLPMSSKLELIKANGKNLVISFSLTELWSLPQKLLNAIPPHSINASVNRLDAKNIERGLVKFKHNLHYSTFIRMQDSLMKEYLFSSPSEDNLVAEGLDKIKNNFSITFKAQECKKSKCTSKKKQDIYSSFKFEKLYSSIPIQANIIAQCNYENIYRREYTNELSIEIAYDNCSVESINGQKPKAISPLLQRLYDE